MPARRVRFALDSSCLIALLSDWHAQHTRTLRSYEQWLAKGAQPVIPVHAILECFSVLTRIPAPHRSMPETAKLALERTFAQTAIIAGMGSEAVWGAIDTLSSLGLGGGRVYDAAIARCAAEAGATLLFTWNTKHFLPIAPAGLEVREP
jgi:predicted nucleic acid-binding protein